MTWLTLLLYAVGYIVVGFLVASMCCRLEPKGVDWSFADTPGNFMSCLFMWPLAAVLFPLFCVVHLAVSMDPGTNPLKRYIAWLRKKRTTPTIEAK